MVVAAPAPDAASMLAPTERWWFSSTHAPRRRTKSEIKEKMCKMISIEKQNLKGRNKWSKLRLNCESYRLGTDH